MFLYSASFIVGGTDPVNTVWCEDDTRYSNMSPACVIQGNVATSHVQASHNLGALFLVFGLATLIWWTLSAIGVYIRVVKKKRDLIERESLYHLVAWGFPLISVIFPFVTSFAKLFTGHSLIRVSIIQVLLCYSHVLCAYFWWL